MIEIEFFENFDQKSKFWEILTTIEFLENFDQNRDFSKFSQKKRVFDNVAKIEILRKVLTKTDFLGKIRPKSKCFENFDQNRDFPINFLILALKIFSPNQNFANIFTKIGIFQHLNQNCDIRKF